MKELGKFLAFEIDSIGGQYLAIFGIVNYYNLAMKCPQQKSQDVNI